MLAALVLFCLPLSASPAVQSPDAPPAAGDPAEVLAEQGGEAITRGRALLLMRLRGVPAAARDAAFAGTVEDLKDRAAMRRFLTVRRATPEEEAVDRQTAALLKSLGEDPAAVFAPGFEDEANASDLVSIA